MGSTYVDFRGKGFEAWDSQLEVWLHLLVDEIDKLDEPPKWLKEVREHWHIHSTEGFGYGVIPDLDHFVTNEEQRARILDLCERALTRLNQYGEYISQEELNSWELGGNSTWGGEQPTARFILAGQYFMRLLQGTLQEDECDARFSPVTKELW